MSIGSRVRTWVISLSIGLIFYAGPITFTAVAQYGDQGVLSAVSYRDIPAGQTIAVRALDNSDENLEIQAEFERILRDSGYSVQRGSSIVLTFDTEDRIGAWNDRSRRTVLELEGRGGVIGRDSASARFNIFDSQRGGIVNKAPSDNSSIRPSRYRLNVSIEQTSGGERLWQGWVSADLQQNSGAALTKAMVPILVQNIGATIKSQVIDLY